MKKKSAKTPLQQVVEIGKQFYERRWMYGTAGNLSLRLRQKPLSFAITPSGLNKGELREQDLLTLDESRPNLRHPLGHRPSAETQIHQAIYRSIPSAGAVFHSHPVHAVILSELYGRPGERTLFRPEWFEMWKALGIQEGEKPEIPIFANWQDISKVAADIKTYLSGQTGKVVPAILIYSHGLTCWGRTPDEARNHVEAIEYICEYLYLKKFLSPLGEVK